MLTLWLDLDHILQLRKGQLAYKLIYGWHKLPHTSLQSHSGNKSRAQSYN